MGKLIDMDRPGIIKPFMVPVKLKDQVRATPRTDLWFQPDGKTLVGGVQWAIDVQRPGLAQPLITAKQEQKASEAIVAEMKKAPGAPTGVEAAAVDKMEVAEANINNSANGGVAGFFSGWGRSRRNRRRR